MEKHIKSGDYSGVIHIPASKSDGQRAILAAALQKGHTILANLGASADEMAMLKTIEQLGAKLTRISKNEIRVEGIRAFPNVATINAGESGLGVRLITSVCAAHTGSFRIEGEGSLLSRPQRFFEEHLGQLGVDVSSKNGCLPLEFMGPMHGGQIEIDGSLSSQFLSGLLMALPLIEDDTTVIVENLASIPYVNMTLNTLSQFGIEVKHEDFKSFQIKGGQRYTCEYYEIQRDWSSASCWLVAAALGHGIVVHGLDLESLQADVALLDALNSAHCMISYDDDLLLIDGEERIPFKFDATHCPDLFPALVTFAAFCDGTSMIKGVHRLKNKESDRGIVLQQEFGKLGLKIEIDDDVMLIHGGTPLNSASVDAHNDHRIAMCLAIAGTFMDGGITIIGAESVAKSYPEFWNDLTGLNTIGAN